MSFFFAKNANESALKNTKARKIIYENPHIKIEYMRISPQMEEIPWEKSILFHLSHFLSF